MTFWIASCAAVAFGLINDSIELALLGAAAATALLTVNNNVRIGSIEEGIGVLVVSCGAGVAAVLLKRRHARTKGNR